MSKYFRFNDKRTHILKMDNFSYSHSYTTSTDYCIDIYLEKDEKLTKLTLCYGDKEEVLKKDVMRLLRFLNEKEKLEK